MKTRKSLDHQKLILEVSTQLMRHFKPDPKQARPRTRSVTRLAHPTHRLRRTHSRPPTPSSPDLTTASPRPPPVQIKKRIEDLIAREYLERDSNNNNVYKYLA